VDARRRLGVTGEVVDAPHHGLDGVRLLDAERLPVDGRLHVRHHAAGGVELRPRGERAVLQGREADVAVDVGPELRGAGRVGGGEGLPEALGDVAGRLARLHPGQHDAVFGDGQQLRHVGPTVGGGLGQPAEAFGLTLEEPLGRLRPGLDDGVAAVAQAQPGGGADVTARDGRGGHDTVAEQGLRAGCGACHACHGADVTA
jgi:hypothetical protein